MAKQEFIFMGKNIDELKGMSVNEFALLANSRARRSLKHGFDKKLLSKIEATREKLKKGAKEVKTIRTHNRDTVVIPQMVGLKFGVYSGKEFKIVEIMPEMIGHYLGEFSLSRTKLKHGKAGIGATKSSTALVAKK